jgi:hypothetical protein
VTSPHRPTLDQRIKTTLTEDGGHIPVVLGLCGTGRSAVLRRVQQELGADRCQYVNVERTATTPERFLDALVSGSPFRDSRPASRPTSPRQAFDAILAFLSGARRSDQGRATFLLDEVLEFRTFESFPGLRRALPEMLAVIASTPNRFVLTSRYVSRTERILATSSPQFVMVPVHGLGADEIAAMLHETRTTGTTGFDRAPAAGGPIDTVSRVIQRLSDGRTVYARALTDMIARMESHGGTDPVAALAALLEPDGRLSLVCGFYYELRLHRARGYGALKAILGILSQKEPLTLTEISQRLGRTPGSTKDYLSWLEDVDLVAVNQKRYRFRDPLLRVWVRLHCRATQPTTQEITAEVQQYAAACLPELVTAP